MRQVPVLCFGFLICQTRITKLSCLKIKYSDSCKLFSKHKLVIILFKYVIAMPFLATNVQFSSVAQLCLTHCLQGAICQLHLSETKRKETTFLPASSLTALPPRPWSTFPVLCVCISVCVSGSVTFTDLADQEGDTRRVDQRHW